nr:MAG TPA: protein of unknown function (DUF5383) [Bacteriophage sp.]
MDKVLDDISIILQEVVSIWLSIIYPIIFGLIFIIAFITLPIWIIPYLIYCMR